MPDVSRFLLLFFSGEVLFEFLCVQYMNKTLLTCKAGRKTWSTFVKEKEKPTYTLSSGSTGSGTTRLSTRSSLSLLSRGARESLKSSWALKEKEIPPFLIHFKRKTFSSFCKMKYCKLVLYKLAELSFSHLQSHPWHRALP